MYDGNGYSIFSSTSDLRSINKARMEHGVCHLSDITKAGGMGLDKKIQHKLQKNTTLRRILLTIEK